MQALTVEGAETRFVGGCVRDSLLNRKDIDNIDIATSLTPEQTLQLLENSGLRAIPTGLEHGTVTAIADNEIFEITTLRHDVKTDGRHATVTFTDDWITDANRRDFTINALFYDASSRTIIDHVDGMRDIRHRTIRSIGNPNERFLEDPVRMLRAVVFAARLDLTLDRAVAAAIRRHRGEIVHSSPARLVEELYKIARSGSSERIIRDLGEAGLLRYLSLIHI